MSIPVSAVVLDEAGEIGVREVVLPEAGPGEVRVRLAAAGVCHSDLSFVNGTLMSPRPIVLGHEGAGIVEAVGDGVDHVKPGDRVLLNWTPACRDCWYCNNGESYLCPNSTQRATSPYAELDDGTPVFQAISTGAFAEQTVVGAAGVVPLPDGLPLEHAAVIGCAVLTGVGAVLNTADVQAGQSVAVVGLGGVGLSVVQGARIAGATTIIGVDASDAKESFAREAGATEFLIAGDDTVAKIQELTGGLGVDHSFEVVGTAATIKLAWSLARRGGNVTIVGVGGREEQISFSPLELWHFTRTIRPSYYGSSDPVRDVPRIADLIRNGEFNLDSLISDEIGLGDVPAAFERMRAGQGARSLIVF
jgi:S-(hydroxymethyl)glutathione dehydrogenase/alcohol dehydrogenase